jgi:hypothetical protein
MSMHLILFLLLTFIQFNIGFKCMTSWGMTNNIEYGCGFFHKEPCNWAWPVPCTCGYGCLPGNNYCPGDGRILTCSKCQPGFYWKDQKPCGPCLDTTCVPCEKGFWCQNEMIKPCTQCGENEYIFQACKPTSDTICKSCATNCSTDEYLYGNCSTPMGPRCLKCPGNSTLRAPGKSYTDCACNIGFKGAILGPYESTCTMCNKTEFCPVITETTCPQK